MSKKVKKDDPVFLIIVVFFLPFVACYYLIKGIVFLCSFISNNRSIKIDSHTNIKLPKQPIKSKRYIQQETIVKESSPLYKAIISTNTKYLLYTINPTKTYVCHCSSKREFDSFNYNNYLITLLHNEKQNYIELIENAKRNVFTYSSYISEYRSIETYATEDFVQKYKLKYKKYNFYEKALYRENQKAKPVSHFSINIKIDYSSPTGRNHYNDEKVYGYEIITKMVEDIENLYVAIKIKNTNQSGKEKQIEKREKELRQKEQEFIEATKEHIYSVVTTEKPNENESQWINLKRLKKAFDNGEISYTDYSEKRKEILK